jgi:hypothetical protein
MNGTQEKLRSEYAQNVIVPTGIEKKCNHCGVRKALSDFYSHKNKSHADGKSSHCKDCVNKHQKEYRSNNVDKRTAMVIKWKKSHPDNVASYRADEYEKKKKKEGFLLRERAHQIIRGMVDRKEIKIPILCSKCTKEKKLVAHHPDYNIPREVEWVCTKCHSFIHGKLALAGIAYLEEKP